MALFCTYPSDLPVAPNASVGIEGPDVTIDCTTANGTVEVTYPTIIVNAQGSNPAKQWFAANLVGASVFTGVNFIAASTGWTALANAAAPNQNSIGATEYDALISNNPSVCRSGFVYKPACIDLINAWLESPTAISQIGAGWRVATRTDFQDLEAAAGGTNTAFKLRVSLLNPTATADDRWSVVTATVPPTGTLNFSGFNAYASATRQESGGVWGTGRVTAWWVGPSSPGAGDNKFGTGNVNTFSTSIYFQNTSGANGAVANANGNLRYNTTTELRAGQATSNFISNVPNTGNSIRLVRDFVDDPCLDLVTSNDALNPTLVAAGAYEPVTFDQTVYPSIWIGAQKWVASNLVETLAPGIPYTPVQADWNTAGTNQTPAYTYYNAGTDLLNCNNGYLFNFYAAEAINNHLIGQGSGQKYRVPSKEDFDELIAFLPGGSDGLAVRTNTPTPLTYWNTSTFVATNSSGFSAVGTGRTFYSNLRVDTRFNTITESTSNPLLGKYIAATGIFSAAFSVSDSAIPKSAGDPIRLLIPSIPVTIVFAGQGTGTVTTTGVDSTITDTGTTGYTIRLRNGEDLTVIATPDSPFVTGAIDITSGVGTTNPISGGVQIDNLSDAITVTVTFTNPTPPAGCDPCTFSELNQSLTYGSVTVNSVCYPTLEIGNLEVTAYNLTIRDVSTLFPSVVYINNSSPGGGDAAWAAAETNQTPACAFWNWTDISTSSNSGDCSRGLLFNWYAIQLINQYLEANNPAETPYSAWRVLTECDAKHIKNSLSIDLPSVCGSGISLGAIGVTANSLSANTSDRCINTPNSEDPDGIGAAMMSTNCTNLFANNNSGYTLVQTGYITLAGDFLGGENSNIWTSTSAYKQYGSATSLNGPDTGWRGIAVDMGDNGGTTNNLSVTVVDHIANNRGLGFALRLCRTLIFPYEFSGAHASSLDTGVLQVGTSISAATSTINYLNSYGEWRINKCEDTVNGVIARAGNDTVAPGWDKLNSPLPGTGDPNEPGQIVVTFSGIPQAAGTFTWSLPIGCETIDITRTVLSSSGSITNLNCSSAASSLTGVLFEGQPASGITFTVNYTGGNGGPYAAQSIQSTGVTGLTATLPADDFNNGAGTLTYTVSGTPADGGTAAFALSFPGPNNTTVSCTVTLDIEEVIIVTFLGCNSATYTPTSPPFYVGASLNQNVSISYAASSGGQYAGDTFTSTGITGLTLTLNPTTVTTSGSFTGTITGVASQTGTAIFTICIGGYNGQDQYCCTLSVPIGQVPPTGGELDCANAVITNGSSLLYPGSYSAGNNITISIPYTGGNGGTYPNLLFPSNGALGVGGLTISAPSGNFAGTPVTPAAGSILFTVIGSPTSAGNAVFNITIGGYSCQVSIPIVELPGDATLNCGASTTSTQVLSGQSVSGITLSIPYTNGNGGTYGSQNLQSIPSGVTALLPPGTLAIGSGTFQLSLNGTMPPGFVPITFLFAFPVGSTPCTITLTPPIDSGTADLDCNSLVVVGSVTYPDPIPANNPIILFINYDNSNGGSYDAATFPSLLASNGVAGLTATLAAGQFQVGSGTLQLTVTGTPQSSGIAYFDVIIGGTSCTLDVPVGAPPGDIERLNCEPSSISVTGTLTNGSPAAGVTFTVPYIGSNGGTYSGNTVNSTNIVTGLTATLAPGTFNQPNGTVTYTVTGTPSGAGNATFPITVANESCTILLTVDPISGTADLDCANATFSNTPVQGFSTSVTGTIPYTNGNGGFYDPYTATVSGLTLTISSGYFSNGSGSVPFTIQGTATVSGTITFTNIQVGDQTCNLTISVSEPPDIINELLCDQAVITGSLVINQPASGVTITIPYDGSNGQPYPEDSSNSTGITGLTATTPAGTLTNPTGVLVYTVTGTPLTTGVATFTITIATQTCVISIPVNPDNFFGPENPSPCQEVTYTDPGCEVLTDTCTILFNGTEVVYTTISTTDPCQVSFQVPCDTEPNSIVTVTFLDCDDNIITEEELPIGDTLPSYLSQTSGCPGDEVTLLDTGCIFANDVTDIQVCYPGSTGCISIGPGTLLNSSLPLPCSIVFTIPVPSPAPFYPANVQIVFEGSSGVLEQFNFTVQNCADTQNSFDPIACALPGDEVTFTNPNCDLVSPDFSELLVGGISATILSVDTTPACSVTFLIPDDVSSGLQEIQFIDDLGNLLGTEEYSVGAVGVGSNYTVTFTPQIDTCHRVYFRTTQEEYCYYQADGPFEIGVPVTVTINLQDYAECLVTVPPTSCDDAIIVTGYIQPCCTNEEALDNRVELNCVQYAATDCGLYSVVCNSSNCGTFTKSNCFASGCTGINDLTEYAFRGNAGIPGNTVYVCSEGNGVQNTTNSTYTITKLSSVAATAYGANILLTAAPFNSSTWTFNSNIQWNPPGVGCPYVGNHVFVDEGVSTGTMASPVVLTIGITYEFTFSMYSELPNTINFTSGPGNTVSVSSPGGSYPPLGTTYQITAQTPGRLSIAIPSVGKGTCFQLTGLRAVQTGIRATCCTCFGAEVVLDLPEGGPTSIEVYYTQCTDNGPQIATTTLTNDISVINCCTYGSVFPVNKFDIDYITSIVYLTNSGC